MHRTGTAEARDVTTQVSNNFYYLFPDTTTFTPMHSRKRGTQKDRDVGTKTYGGSGEGREGVEGSFPLKLSLSTSNLWTCFAP
jgi:hypothetical protein